VRLDDPSERILVQLLDAEIDKSAGGDEQGRGSRRRVDHDDVQLTLSTDGKERVTGEGEGSCRVAVLGDVCTSSAARLAYRA
jgi:hypothetical protein